MLAGADRSMTGASSVDEAIEMMAAKPPDVVMLDFHLRKGTSASDLLSAMAASPRLRAVPVIVTTGAPRDLSATDRSRVFAVLAKPCTESRLRQVLDSALDKPRIARGGLSEGE